MVTFFSKFCKGTEEKQKHISSNTTFLVQAHQKQTYIIMITKFTIVLFQTGPVFKTVFLKHILTPIVS